VQMRQPFDQEVDEQEPLFYALPQPPMPDKNYSAGQPAVVYERPDSAS